MSDDLISRQAAIDIVFRSPFFFDSLTEELRALPSVQQKTGRWTLDRVSYLLEYVCTNCKASFPSIASEGEFYSKLNCANPNTERVIATVFTELTRREAGWINDSKGILKSGLLHRP